MIVLQLIVSIIFNSHTIEGVVSQLLLLTHQLVSEVCWPAQRLALPNNNWTPCQQLTFHPNFVSCPALRQEASFYSDTTARYSQVSQHYCLVIYLLCLWSCVGDCHNCLQSPWKLWFLEPLFCCYSTKIIKFGFFYPLLFSKSWL